MNSSRTLSCMLAVSLALLIGGCGKSDPKAVVKDLAQAMEKGDAATVKADSVNADPAFIDSMATFMASAHKLHDAAVAKFGKDGESISESKIPDAIKQVDDSDVKIDGDTATLTPKNGGQAITLKKVSGDWKVDFSKMEGMDKASEAGPMMKSMSDAQNQVADEIAAGKYSTVAEAKKAVGEKMMSGMLGGMKLPDAGK